MRLSAVCVLAVLATTACGRKVEVTHDAGGHTVTTTDLGGRKVVATAAASLPGDLPAWAPSYPGSAVYQVVNMDVPGGVQRIVTLTTADPRSKVLQFYDERLAKLGVKPMMSSEATEGAMRAVSGFGGQPDTLTVGDVEGKTGVNISYRAPG